MKTPEEIYLIPSTDADYDYVWCEDPAPTDSHDASEAVRYVRADVVERLEQERDQLKAVIGVIESMIPITPNTFGGSYMMMLEQSHVDLLRQKVQEAE